MEKQTSSYTYFHICSNGIITERGLKADEAGIFDPDDITKLLGIEPFSKWKKGDAKPNAQNCPNIRPYNFSGWSAEKSTVGGLDIGEQCIETIQNLKAKISELLEIKSLYDVSFWLVIVPHIYNEQAPAVSFGKDIIEFCYLTGTEIDVDIYVYQNFIE